MLTDGGKTTPDHTLGALAVAEDGKTYRYVKNTLLALDTNDLVTYVSMANFTVTQDISGGNAEQPAGVYDQATQIAADEFFWLQVAGESQVNSEIITTIAAGDPLIPHATADGEADELDDTSATTVKAGIGQMFAVAIAAEVSGTPDTTKCRLVGLA